jgi:hypothetical protein
MPLITREALQANGRNLKEYKDMQFTLAGFTEQLGYRVYAFEQRGPDKISTEYTVKADLALVRRYGIRVQELPLLCLALLKRREETQESARTLTFTEEDMRLHSVTCAAARDAAALRRKPARRPAKENIGSGWRVPPR